MIDLHIQTLGGIVRRHERDTPAQLWDAAEEVGYTTATVPAHLDGGDGTMDDGVAIARAAARVLYNAPVAVASVVLGPLLAAAGWRPREGVPAVVVSKEAPTAVSPVDFGASAELVYLVTGAGDASRVRLLDLGARAVVRTPARAADPAHVAYIDLAGATVVDEVGLAQPYEHWLALGALSSASQIAGAVDAVLERTVDYLNTRVQFGRPLIRFQALQHRVAELAARSELLGNAVDLAVERWIDTPADAVQAAAVATIEAAQVGPFAVSEAHQLHGAIGYTEESGLGEYSKLVWSQCRRHGSVLWWREWLSRCVEAGDVWAATAPHGTAAPAS
jgi:acyl-CoA dehydrogenase